MSNVNAVEGIEKVYTEATSTLTKLSKSRHRASRVYSRLVQGLIIWFAILSASLVFASLSMQKYYYREAKSEVNPIDLVSTVVVVISTVKCITLVTAIYKFQPTLRRAYRNFYELSESLHRSQNKQVSYDK
jgi:magnesium-transporting ATPase (P-type)